MICLSEPTRENKEDKAWTKEYNDYWKRRTKTIKVNKEDNADWKRRADKTGQRKKTTIGREGQIR